MHGGPNFARNSAGASGAGAERWAKYILRTAHAPQEWDYRVIPLLWGGESTPPSPARRKPTADFYY